MSSHFFTNHLPQVVGLGVRGLFTIIQDVWQTMPPLCLRALKEFLNILQGQTPAGLHNEPKETTGMDCIYDLPELLCQQCSWLCVWVIELVLYSVCIYRCFVWFADEDGCGASPCRQPNGYRCVLHLVYWYTCSFVRMFFLWSCFLLSELSSVACSCLLSLVVALGDTGKMLTALASMITAPSHLTQSTLQVWACPFN